MDASRPEAREHLGGDTVKCRDENFQRIREISRILSHQDRSCESSRSVEIFLDQYRGVGVFIPHDKFIRIALFRSVNRPFVVSESRAT